MSLSIFTFLAKYMKKLSSKKSALPNLSFYHLLLIGDIVRNLFDRLRGREDDGGLAGVKGDFY